MPFYSGLRAAVGPDRTPFVVERLQALRAQLRAEIPVRSITDDLMLATWNVRDFGGSRLNPQPRLPESLYYLAEIASCFDLIAVQEVNDRMEEFGRMMSILGPSYDYIATDVTEGGPGNLERMVFIYDRRKIRFRNIAGEIVLPKNDLLAGVQFARSPFLCSFQAGWLKFNLCTVHMLYGEGSEGMAQRVREIAGISSFLKKRADKSGEAFLVLGDFNIIGEGHETMNALESGGFKIPPELKEKPSNFGRDKYYDQIAYRSRTDRIKISPNKPNAGVFDFFQSVFREDEDYSAFYSEKALRSHVGKSPESARKYYAEKWRTWQMSDHLPW
ncbi:MAG: endonuclease/exonuclease/phosphatase family protein, partial [Fimbriimonadaceae bacterium]|nr:endonuclease/exonuclease/phosphatase family protein [Fimbriimonadaceae bacterium]